MDNTLTAQNGIDLNIKFSHSQFINLKTTYNIFLHLKQLTQYQLFYFAKYN